MSVSINELRMQALSNPGSRETSQKLAEGLVGNLFESMFKESLDGIEEDAGFAEDVNNDFLAGIMAEKLAASASMKSMVDKVAVQIQGTAQQPKAAQHVVSGYQAQNGFYPITGGRYVCTSAA